MIFSPSRCCVAVLCCLVALPAWAVKVHKVDIQGLDNEALEANVRSALSLQQELDRKLTGRRLNYLLRQADTETRDALEPFGYYSPTITVQRSDRPNGDASSDTPSDASSDAPGTDDDRDTRDPNRTLTVHIRVQLGLPVRVRHAAVGVQGAAHEDATVAAAIAAFQPRQGDVLDHTQYERSKARIAHALARHGYFNATADLHRVEVTRAEHAADIDLQWRSGERHSLGTVRFLQTPTPILNDALLQKLVNWEPGAPFDETRIDRLRNSLTELDYFGVVDVQAQPDPAQATRVPVVVNLSPAPRSIYSAGVSYGTLSGPGVRLGVERRYLNRRGHKALAQIDYASKRKLATLQYRIPAFAWLDGWYTASLQAADEQTDSLDTRRLEFVVSRSGQYNTHLNLIASAHVLRERWSYFTLNKPLGFYQYASFAFPELRAEYIDVDQRLAPRRGAGGSLTLRAGKGNATGFAQLHAEAQWFHGFDANSRVLVRGEAGRTFAGDLQHLPPSLRFFAGGDRSVRGYGWREIGPRIRNSQGEAYALGAANVVSASLEYERYFNGPWGAAAFVDTGSAFNGRNLDLHTGVGIGLRWRSPVGPVRIDIAHGLNAPDSPLTLHLNIGADL